MKKKMNGKKGFTLMEMLIVVAIIAVLVAIAIPTFTSSLTKAKQAADNANVRAAYAECMAKALTNGEDASQTVTVQAAWDGTKIGDASVTSWSAGTVTVSVTYNADGTASATVS